ncbi:MAG: formylglycine-generating enzyme family protein [Planctomycetota bacterium]|jgi:formylglycine-generating enzyme required for sulfatase activity
MRWLPLLLALLLCAPSRAGENGRIPALIDALGSTSVILQEQARAELLRLGDESSPFVSRALRHPDPLVRFNAQWLWRIPEWAWPYPDSSYDPKTRLPLKVLDRGTCITLVLIPAGSCMYGAAKSDPLRDGAEWPAQRLVLRRPFYLGCTEVTREQWRRVLSRDTRPLGKRGRYPAAGISYSEIRRFLAATALRLPTEREWEYACRAGSRSSRYGDLDAIAWHRGNSIFRAQPVAYKEPNAFGLYDMLGNVCELCSGRYVAPFAVQSTWIRSFRTGPLIRGGSFIHYPSLVRANYRVSHTLGWPTVGFRVARDP